MQAFGTTGYGAEAVEVILEVVKGHPYTPGVAMDAGDTEVLGAGWEACWRIGGEAVEPLREGLKNPIRNTRRFVVEALRRLGPDARAVAPDLVAAIADKDPVVRGEALAAVQEIDPQARGFVPAIVRALRDPEPNVRHQAAVTAGYLGPKAEAAVPRLIELLDDESSAWAAFEALQRTGGIDTSAVPGLARLLKTAASDRGQAATVIGALAGLGPKARAAVPAIVRFLTPEDPGMASHAIQALIRIGPEGKAVLPALRDYLKAPLPAPVRELTVQAIRKFEQQDK
jgi:HEAT repeat protein